jgi:hypothetical protein
MQAITVADVLAKVEVQLDAADSAR